MTTILAFYLVPRVLFVAKSDSLCPEWNISQYI